MNDKTLNFKYIELAWCNEHQNKVMIRTDVMRTKELNCLLCEVASLKKENEELRKINKSITKQYNELLIKFVR